MNYIFLLVIFSFLTVLWLYGRSCLWRYVVYPSKGSSRSMLGWDLIFWSFHSVGFFYKMFPTPFWHTPLGTWIGRAGYFFMGLCWLLFVWGLFLDIMSWTVNYLNKKESAKDEDFDPSRRLLPQKALVFGGLGTVGAVSAIGVYHALTPKLYEVNIPLAKKFPGLKGLTITQISDIHIGPVLKKDFLETVVKRANAAKSDLIVITGDLIDGFVDQMRGELQSLKKLEAPMGVFYVTGNHEYYWGGEEWVEFVEAQGITALMNTHKILKYNGTDFCLAGITDMKAERFVTSHRSDPYKSLPIDNDDICKIMLAHRPKSCYQVQKVGAHLQLSGHTHGGQGIPWKFAVKLVQPFLAGLYDHKGMWVYVNRGTGFWGPPARAGIQSEITKLTIT